MPTARLLRLSVTDRCNFRCRYCVPAKGFPATPIGKLLSLAELVANVSWLVQHIPIERVKLTGGEPLVRPGLDDLISRLARVPGIREISMTTNGSLLSRKVQALKAAGLARVNISLNSLDPQRFAELSRGARLERTLKGIDTAIVAGLRHIKINVVLQRSIWRRDVPHLLDLVAGRGLEIRFIELMRTGTERAWCDSEYVSVEEVKDWLATQTAALPVATPAALPARQSMMFWKGALLTVGWIAPRSRPFCNSCERLRMDSRGHLRRCLMDSETIDLVKLRRIPDPEAAAKALHAYLAAKHIPIAMDSESAMNQIGG
jgi:cyclic pyranopterin phosphate synthase